MRSVKHIIVWALGLSGLIGLLVVTACAPAQTPTPLLTPTDRPPAEATAERSIEPTNPAAVEAATSEVTSMPAGDPDEAPVATAATPGSALAEGATFVLQEPLLIDGEQGRMYAAGQANLEERTLVLSTVDGRLLAAWEPAGVLALDRAHRRLIVDDGQLGLTVLDALTGAPLASVDLPVQESVVAPQVDPDNGVIYAFRAGTIYLVEPDSWQVTQTADLQIPYEACSQPGGAAAIRRSDYDLIAKRLYLTYITATCTPWATVTIVTLDATTLEPLGEYVSDPSFQAVPFLGSFYGSTAPRIGPDLSWAWRDDRLWHSAAHDGWRSLRGIVADWGRQLIYEALDTEIRILEANSHEVVGRVTLDLLESGRLVGHDPVTDQLYLLAGSGRLLTWPAANLFAAGDPPQPAAAAVPSRPVLALAVSPAWPADPTLVGIWENGDCSAEGGQLFMRTKEAGDWSQLPLVGDGACDAAAAVALSPNYPQDRVLFVASNDQGTVLKSADGGQSWQAAHSGLPAGARFRSLALSANYSQDHTLFAHLADGRVFRSRDDNQSWQELPRTFDQFALSPEYNLAGQGETLMGAAGSELYLSQDGGDQWELVGPTPGNEPLILLEIAPQFSRWRVLFALTTTGSFYRSLDAGSRWEYVLGSGPPTSAQILFASGPETSRPIFLLLDGRLENSYDGWNSTWGVAPRFAVPPREITTLAIAPDFEARPVLFAGTADGQVIPGDAAAPTPFPGD